MNYEVFLIVVFYKVFQLEVSIVGIFDMYHALEDMAVVWRPCRARWVQVLIGLACLYNWQGANAIRPYERLFWA